MRSTSFISLCQNSAEVLTAWYLCRGVSKPMPSLFGQQQKETSDESDSEESALQAPAVSSTANKVDEDENPF